MKRVGGEAGHLVNGQWKDQRARMPGLLCDGKVQRNSFIAGKGVGPFPPLPLENALATQWAPTQWSHQGKR